MKKAALPAKVSPLLCSPRACNALASWGMFFHAHGKYLIVMSSIHDRASETQVVTGPNQINGVSVFPVAEEGCTISISPFLSSITSTSDGQHEQTTGNQHQAGTLEACGEDDTNKSIDQSQGVVVEYNKFKYPEFAGPEGRGLLSNIIKQIVPKVSHETWYSSVSYQKDENECYVGAARQRRDLAIRGNLSDRAIRWRWQQLEMRGLVAYEQKIVEIKQQDGSIRFEIRHTKNFDALYDLAHEFYYWWKSGRYAQLPPTRDNAPAIRSNPELATWLLRFDCYRSILLHDKPGRKPQPQASYHEVLERRLAEQIRRDEEMQNMQKNMNRQVFSNTFSEQVAVNTNTHLNSLYKDGFTNSKLLEEETGDPSATIGILNTHSPKQNKTNISLSSSSSHSTTTKGDEDTMRGGGQAPPEHQGDAQSRADATRSIIWGAQGKTPRKLIAHIMTKLAPVLNDDAPIASTITRTQREFEVKGIWDTAVICEAIEMSALFALSLDDQVIERRHTQNNYAVYTPVFFATLRKKARYLAKLQRETREVEQCYSIHHSSASEEAAPEEEIPSDPPSEQMVQNPQTVIPAPPPLSEEAHRLLAAANLYAIELTAAEEALIAQNDTETMRVLQEVIDQVEFEQHVQGEKDHYNMRAREAIKRLVPECHIIVRSEENACDACGSMIAHRVRSTIHCVVCKPFIAWSKPKRQTICQIVQSIPTEQQIRQAYYDQYCQPLQSEDDSHGYDQTQHQDIQCTE